MNISEWNVTCENVKKHMVEYVKYFITPIFKVLKDNSTQEEYGEHFASGSFIQINHTKHLITNEHVTREIQHNSLAHQFLNSDCVLRIVNHFYAKEYPLDIAITKIDEIVWNQCQHNSIPIPLTEFLPQHNPVDGELLFIIGYSGERSKFLFNNLFSAGTPYVTQEKSVQNKTKNDIYHFAIHYEPEKAINFENNSKGLPNPSGFSGSLVWNTRFVEQTKLGNEWKSSDAKVTGLIFSWDPDNTCLWATKVEHFELKEYIKQLESNT